MTPGRVLLRPGGPPPTVVNERPLLAPRLARGRRADELPGLLGALFTLCGHAHRRTAARAVAAARGAAALSDAAQRQALRAATARDQLLRLAYDGPRLLPGAPAIDTADALRGCPLFEPGPVTDQRLAALPGWLAQHWLGGPVGDWLQRWADDPADWPLRWCHAVDTPPARLLRSQADALRRLATPEAPLWLLEQPLATLPPLARRIAEQPDFCAQPDWLGQPSETGPWTRINSRVRPRLHNAWMRLTARLVDLLQLAAPDGHDWLAEGALPLARGEGIAWTEMARGLLVHHVQLDDAGCVRSAAVLAPTEWNFHPEGVLARTLAALPEADRAAQAARAAVAFDPCVEFVVATPEPAHA
ncbi:MAG: hypothetical protein KIT35_25280 [Piscinibacter sp.]|uniref:hypothetical protein n=1 Tax=Piscinibacter sp. TaxID=1903157 RepID=UPI002586FDF5|nr:hypothetical protein [Piscinibacter sp.]MCW5667163.1 hypothetical protein [Piscinibacter sp.]